MEKSKEVKMNTKKGADEEKKLSYEELNNAAIQLSKENQYLRAQLQGANRALSTYNELDYLFRVVECAGANRNNSVCFADEFVEKCVGRIQEIMTPPKEEAQEEENKEK